MAPSLLKPTTAKGRAPTKWKAPIRSEKISKEAMNSRVRKVLLLGNVVLALLALSAKAAPGGGGTKPVLLTAPKSINNATVGSAITLAATASGSPAPQWKWYLQGIQIPGATNSSLVLTNAQPTDGGAFQVVAYNSAGQDKASFTVNFKLDPLPFADDFAKRGTITGNSGLGAGSNTSAKKETGEPAHWSGKHDRTVWLQWTAPSPASPPSAPTAATLTPFWPFIPDRP